MSDFDYKTARYIRDLCEHAVESSGLVEPTAQEAVRLMQWQVVEAHLEEDDDVILLWIHEKHVWCGRDLELEVEVDAHQDQDGWKYLGEMYIPGLAGRLTKDPSNVWIYDPEMECYVQQGDPS